MWMSITCTSEVSKLMNRSVMAKRISRKFSVLLPAKQEQRAKLPDFLDRKTGQIDELIRIKERRIELLQEQRTALINQAVTKGLDPNVEMKPSGVEWIGEIPVHWEISKVKHEFEQIWIIYEFQNGLNSETCGNMKFQKSMITTVPLIKLKIFSTRKSCTF